MFTALDKGLGKSHSIVANLAGLKEAAKVEVHLQYLTIRFTDILVACLCEPHILNHYTLPFESQCPRSYSTALRRTHEEGSHDMYSEFSIDRYIGNLDDLCCLC